MAEECVTVLVDSPEGQYELVFCWDAQTIEPTWNREDVTTGLRKEPWMACQYYLSMPGVCKYWTEGGQLQNQDFHCSYRDDDNNSDYPTGYNFSQCDFLGRRHWCNKYESDPNSDSSAWICAAPNPYVTGVGIRARTADAPILVPARRDQIYGYNDSGEGKGVGLCDCMGMGRGAEGCAAVGQVTQQYDDEGNPDQEATDQAKIKLILELPVKCSFYRPWRMGFGTIDPQKLKRSETGILYQATVDEAIEEYYADDPTTRRLPTTFEVYNYRAKFQKCQWYDKAYGSDFILTTDTNAQIILEEEAVGNPFDSNNRLIYCSCPDPQSDPFCTRWTPPGAFPTFATENVIAEGGFSRKGYNTGPTIICNGAKPECPCYTGKWIYCLDAKMHAGMPITAQQIMELRFWSRQWDNQDQYVRAYTFAPNRDDAPTTAIYTFDQWENLGDDVSKYEERQGVGKEIDLCVPPALGETEFSEEYITKEVVYYAPPHMNTGTTANTQLHFPSLVRQPQFEAFRPLEIVYPYYNENVFTVDKCEPRGAPGIIKRTSSIKGDYIYVVGYTIRGLNVYSINTHYVNVPSVLSEYYGVYEMEPEVQDETNLEIRNAIENAFRYNPQYISKTTSHAQMGSFVNGPVRLKYGAINDIVTIVDFGDGTYEYLWRKVLCMFYGGVITQSSYEHDYPADSEDGYRNHMPRSIRPVNAYMKFDLTTFGPTQIADVQSVHSEDIPSISDPHYNYSYAIVYEEQEIDTSVPAEDRSDEDPYAYWTAIGRTSFVWVHIEDTNLNYVFPWEVEEATMEPVIDENTGEQVDPQAESTPLKQVYTSLDQKYLHPNVCILGPESSNTRQMFTPSSYYLVIKYKYQKLINELPGEDTEVYFGAGKDSNNRYKSSPYEVKRSDIEVTVEPVIEGTVKLLATFNDENGRLISSFATKGVAMMVIENCRPVDIYYKYRADGRSYILEPRSGFCIDVRNDSPYGEPNQHWEAPRCGDHMNGGAQLKVKGPMWYPYNACSQYMLYDVFTFANNCVVSYVGPTDDSEDNGFIGLDPWGLGVVLRDDYRYCGPKKYEAWCEIRGNWAAACDCGWKYLYSDASNSAVVFEGWAKRRGVIDNFRYAEFGWTMPPFGNTGRNMVQKFLSHDYIAHFTGYPPPLQLRKEWMPMVMDNQMFFFSFDAFDTVDEELDLANGDGRGIDAFRFVNAMSFSLSTLIGETVQSSTRYRFEDILKVNYEGNCSYPPPTIVRGTITTNNFYTFENEEHVWAWQEKWRDVERNLENAGEVAIDGVSKFFGKLDFIIEFEKPIYIYDIYKEEHRLITDEGEYDITYFPPEIDEETGYLSKNPALSLNGGPERPMKIIYGEQNDNGVWTYTDSNYGDDRIDWSDEGGDANLDASSDADNLYEETGDERDWIHDENTLFDPTAVSGTEEAEEAGRNVAVGTDQITLEVNYKYFNRGIIPYISKSRLSYLPKDEEEWVFAGDKLVGGEGGEMELSVTPDITEDPDTRTLGIVGQGKYIWDTDPVTISGSVEDPTTIGKVIIEGRWGYYTSYGGESFKVVKPGLNVIIKSVDGGIDNPNGYSAHLADAVTPEQDQDMREYKIEARFNLTPIDMVYKRFENLLIYLNNAVDGYIIVDNLEIYTYKFKTSECVEKIKIWERKYIVSTYDPGYEGGDGEFFNPDGPQDLLHYNFDLDLSGQYFRFKDSPYDDTEISTSNKLRGVYAGVYHEDDEELEITYDNLHNIEAEEQQKDYRDALKYDEIGEDGKVWLYTPITPPKLTQFIVDEDGLGRYINSSDVRIGNGLTITAPKLSWDELTLVKSFKQYNYWRPGGHYYTWNPNFRRERCTLFGPVEDVFDARFVHVDHQGTGSPLAGPDVPIDPGNSYYSLRLYAQEAKYQRFLVLSGVKPDGKFDYITPPAGSI